MMKRVLMVSVWLLAAGSVVLADDAFPLPSANGVVSIFVQEPTECYYEPTICDTLPTYCEQVRYPTVCSD